MSDLKRSSELSHMIDPSGDVRRTIVISVCGPAGSGKSQVARATAEALGKDLATRIPADYFFVPRSEGMSLADFYEQQLAGDWGLIKKRLALSPGTTTSTPHVDFDAFRRWSDIGGLPLIIRPIAIVDAIAPYPESDLVVRLNVSEDERRLRIMERDDRWNTRVIDRWKHLEMTCRAYAMLHADFEIDGMQPVEVNASFIASAIRGLKGRGDPGGRYR